MVNKYIHFSKKGILKAIAFGACILFIPYLSFYLQRHYPANNADISYQVGLEYLRLIEGGFKSFIADIFYIKGILSLSGESLERIEQAQNNFASAILLDPGLVQAYFFAGIVIARDYEGINKGIVFLKKYLALNPLDWRIPYWIGYDYFQAGDYFEAAKWYARASKLPRAPYFLKSNQVMLHYKSGTPGVGILYLEGLLSSVKDKQQLIWLNLKLQWLKDIVFLEQKVSEFKTLYKRLPFELPELVSCGLISSVPEDKFGSGYYFDQVSGAVKSRFVFSEKK